ncbi:hypothetical protein CDAR_69441 [Caerostris darwini]|uniref:Uncharacterized protein n=1 Tax=Caerostris darwini TaxID=1538125 RepID=A0AAV4U0M6_9ARAC|nr:hypothetical protein CDAR_69441 [Caerostris darwini]
MNNHCHVVWNQQYSNLSPSPTSSYPVEDFSVNRFMSNSGREAETFGSLVTYFRTKFSSVQTLNVLSTKRCKWNITLLACLSKIYRKMT